MDPEFRVKRTRRENRVDYAEIVEYLECTGLDAFAARPLEGRLGGFNQTKRDPAAREIERQRQARWPCSDNQHRLSYIVRLQFSGTVYECQVENRN